MQTTQALVAALCGSSDFAGAFITEAVLLIALAIVGLWAVWSFYGALRIRRLKHQLVESERRWQSLEAELVEGRDKILQQQMQCKVFEARLTDATLQGQNIRQDYERRLLERETDHRTREHRLLELEKRCTELEGQQANRIEEYTAQIRSLVQARENLESDRKKVKEDEARSLNEVLERRRVNWQNHEKNVVEILRSLCSRLGVVWFDEQTFPFARKPDFAIELADQLVIFDAKAPADPRMLDNFPDYLRKQAEAMEKYLKQESVRREAFLVVPTDAIASIKDRFFFAIGEYKIYVICPEALEAVLRLLMKIDEYEVLEALDPQAQEELANYIGRASRAMKKRVQVDHYMSAQFLEILASGEASLPSEILAKAQLKERAFAINPPRTERGKDIALSDLADGQRRIDQLPPIL